MQPCQSALRHLVRQVQHFGDTIRRSRRLGEHDEHLVHRHHGVEDDGEIDEKERSALERFREKRGISKERAIELENQLLSVGDLNEAEKEYLEEYQEILNEGEITEKERRILDRMANRAGISEDRIKELEKFV